MRETLKWEMGGGWRRGSRNRERKREKESTCGSHYSLGQDTVVLNVSFVRGELVA